MRSTPSARRFVRAARLATVALGLVLAAVGVAAACGSTEGLFGQQLYEHSCAGCHGANGNGGTGPAIGAGTDSVSLTDEQIAGVIRAGPGTMPAYPRLGDDQVASLVTYLRALQQAGG